MRLHLFSVFYCPRAKMIFYWPSKITGVRVVSIDDYHIKKKLYKLIWSPIFILQAELTEKGKKSSIKLNLEIGK